MYKFFFLKIKYIYLIDNFYYINDMYVINLENEKRKKKLCRILNILV